MKPTSLLHTIAGLLLCLGIIACSSGRNQPSSTYHDFKNWVSNTSATAADKSEEEWKELKREYKTFTDKLDREEDRMKSKTKAEYRELKQDYKRAEASAGQRQQEGRNRPAMADTESVTPGNMLGKFSQVELLTAEELPEAYQEFMRTVRTNMKSWTNQQWDEAELVYKQLEQQRNKVNLSTSDSLRVRTWQGEYHTLKATYRKL